MRHCTHTFTDGHFKGMTIEFETDGLRKVLILKVNGIVPTYERLPSFYGIKFMMERQLREIYLKPKPQS